MLAVVAAPRKGEKAAKIQARGWPAITLILLARGARRA
jgi:hypothetical protein